MFLISLTMRILISTDMRLKLWYNTFLSLSLDLNPYYRITSIRLPWLGEKSNIQSDPFKTVPKYKTLYFTSNWTQNINECTEIMLQVPSTVLNTCCILSYRVSRERPTCNSSSHDVDNIFGIPFQFLHITWIVLIQDHPKEGGVW